MGSEYDYQVPKIIHFIWAGGDKLMNDSAVETVADWCLQNATCTVILWVDSDYSGGMADMVHAYSALFLKYGVPVIDENSTPVRDAKTHQPNQIEINTCKSILIKDISEFKDDIYFSEIRQLSPNFGCSSDILRLRILAKYGGCYFDQDVAPHPEYRLEMCDFFSPQSHPVLGLEHKSQKLPPTDSGNHGSQAVKDFFRFDITTIGNDSLIATADNPVIKGMLLHIENNYHISETNRKRIIEESYGSRDKHNRTIIRTGSYALKEYIRKNTDFETNSKKLSVLTCGENIQIQVEPIRQEDRILTVPKKNTRHWLQSTLQEPDSCIDTLVEKTLHRIVFEIQHFKVLSLDLHLHNFINALPNNQKKQSEHWVNTVLEKISQLDLSPVAMAQISPEHKKTIRFCQKHKLITLFDLKGSEFIYAIQNQLHIGELHSLSNYLKYHADTLGKPHAEIKTERPELFQRLTHRTHACLDTLHILLKPPFSKGFSSEQTQSLCHYFKKQKSHFTFIKDLLKKEDTLLEKKVSYLFYTLHKLTAKK